MGGEVCGIVFEHFAVGGERGFGLVFQAQQIRFHQPGVPVRGRQFQGILDFVEGAIQLTFGGGEARQPQMRRSGTGCCFESFVE